MATEMGSSSRRGAQETTGTGGPGRRRGPRSGQHAGYMGGRVKTGVLARRQAEERDLRRERQVDERTKGRQESWSGGRRRSRHHAGSMGAREETEVLARQLA